MEFAKGSSLPMSAHEKEERPLESRHRRTASQAETSIVFPMSIRSQSSIDRLCAASNPSATVSAELKHPKGTVFGLRRPRLGPVPERVMHNSISSVAQVSEKSGWRGSR